jgi:hypothetical protein
MRPKSASRPRMPAGPMPTTHIVPTAIRHRSSLEPSPPGVAHSVVRWRRRACRNPSALAAARMRYPPSHSRWRALPVPRGTATRSRARPTSPTPRSPGVRSNPGDRARSPEIRGPVEVPLGCVFLGRKAVELWARNRGGGLRSARRARPLPSGSAAACRRSASSSRDGDPAGPSP